MSLATKYRPKTFEEVCGQNITVSTLERVIEKKAFKNCYIFAGKSGSGKAQPLDSLIQTPEGPVTMKDIQVGNQIFGHDGKIYEVLGKFPQGKRPVYKITLSDGTTVRCDVSHIWNVRIEGSTDGFENLDAQEVYRAYKHSRAKIEVRPTEPVSYPEKQYEVSPYVFGENIIDQDRALKLTDSTIPTEYLRGSISQRRLLLGGIFHPQIGVVQSLKWRQVKTRSKALADDIATLARSLGIFVTVNKSLFTNSYSVRIKLSELIISTVSGQHMKRYITKMVPDGYEDCCCIMTSNPEGLYLTDNFIVTHNTTCARIFAKMINNGVGEPIEIDAASNNGVDNVRALTELAQQRAIDGEYRVIVLDEAQGLTSQAWQAFLKCLEDCPKYTIFIFCTTDPQKLPATILNRMQKYTFAPLNSEDIRKRLEYICQQEGFTNYTDACDFIAKYSNGGMRDAISYLEQCADFSTDLSMENVKQILTGASHETAFRLTWALHGNQEKEIIEIIDGLYSSGQDLKYFIDWYMSFILDLIKYIEFRSIDITGIPARLATAENGVVQYTVAPEGSLEYFNKLLDKILEIKSAIRNDDSYKNTILVMLINIARTLK